VTEPVEAAGLPDGERDHGGGSGVSEPREPLIDLAQRAAGVVAARRRGDHAGAVALMNDFDDADQRAMGFSVVADLAVLLLSQAVGLSIEECLRDMTLVPASRP
jgi:hypothetical protein